jgi:hypothetical protein
VPKAMLPVLFEYQCTSPMGRYLGIFNTMKFGRMSYENQWMMIFVNFFYHCDVCCLGRPAQNSHLGHQKVWNSTSRSYSLITCENLHAIISDNAERVISDQFKQFCSRLGTKHITTTFPTAITC